MDEISYRGDGIEDNLDTKARGSCSERNTPLLAVISTWQRGRNILLQFCRKLVAKQSRHLTQETRDVATTFPSYFAK
jgi:hypothetical protein